MAYKALENLYPYSISLLTSICALAHPPLATLASVVPGACFFLGTLHLLFSASQNVHLLVIILSHFFTSLQYFLKYYLTVVVFPAHSTNDCTSLRHDFQSHSLLYFSPQYLLPYSVLYIFFLLIVYTSQLEHKLPKGMNYCMLFTALFLATRIMCGT